MPLDGRARRWARCPSPGVHCGVTCEQIHGHTGQPQDRVGLGSCAEPPRAPRDKGYEAGSRRHRARPRGPGRPRPSCWGWQSFRELPSTPGWQSERRGEEAQTACQGAEEANLGSPGDSGQDGKGDSRGPTTKGTGGSERQGACPTRSWGGRTGAWPCPHVLQSCSPLLWTHI